jgi:hypothetical protein
VSRFLSYLRKHHIALLALFVAMGGTSYAAFKLPNNSVGSKQIKTNAVNASKVKNGSLLAGDFKAGQLPAGAQGVQGIQGLKGDKGDPCLASNPNCKGPKGDTGPQGPGALSIDGQFPVDGAGHTIATINGMTVTIGCIGGGGGSVRLTVDAVDSDHSFYGWGTEALNGTLSPISSGVDNIGDGGPGTNIALDVVAESTAAGQTVKWTRFDILLIRGTVCNYHALIIPPS